MYLESDSAAKGLHVCAIGRWFTFSRCPFLTDLWIVGGRIDAEFTWLPFFCLTRLEVQALLAFASPSTPSLKRLGSVIGAAVTGFFSPVKDQRCGRRPNLYRRLTFISMHCIAGYTLKRPIFASREFLWQRFFHPPCPLLSPFAFCLSWTVYTFIRNWGRQQRMGKSKPFRLWHLFFCFAKPSKPSRPRSFWPFS